jgi:hypothetical protein
MAAPGRSALPCKVDYFNDKQMTDGARLARSARGKKDARTMPYCLGMDARRPGKRSVCRILTTCEG